MLEHLGQIQITLRELGLDGWLIYDYQGGNPVAERMLGLGEQRLTRRYFFWLPAEGIPCLLVHRTDAEALSSLPGDRVRYDGWGQLRDELARMIPRQSTVAMEYCPMGSNPDLSWVDGGTLELVRSCGVDVVSSGDLSQRCLCSLNPLQLESHRRAGRAMDSIKRDVAAFIRSELASGRQVSERRVQAWLVAATEQASLAGGHPPVVAFGPHTVIPHYVPTDDTDRDLIRGDLLQIDLAAREPGPEGIFAQLSWVGFCGAKAPRAYEHAFAVVADARDQAIELMGSRAENGRRLLGFEVDEAARKVVAAEGWAINFPHRTGHALGPRPGPECCSTLDGLEIQDTRPLLPNVAWSVHPGVYFSDYGVRAKVSLYLSTDGPELTTTAQKHIDTLIPTA